MIKNKYDLDKIKYILSQRGYNLLSNEYKNNKTKLDIEKEGYYYQTTIGAFLKGYEPMKVSSYNKFSFKNIQKILKDNPEKYHKVILIEGNYENNIKCSLTLKCNQCDNIFKSSWNSISNNNFVCPNCSVENNINKHMFSNEKIIKELSHTKYTYIERDDKTNLIIVKDDEGYLYKNRLYSLKNNNNLLKVFPSNQFSCYNIKRYLENKNILLKLKDNDYKGKDKLLNFQCSCGKIFKTSWHSILSGVTTCKKCSLEKGAKLRTIPIEIKKLNIEKKGYKVLKVTDNGLFIIEDKKGYKSQSTYNNIICNNGFYRFKECNIFREYNLNKFLQEKDSSSIVMEFINNREVALKCTCGISYKAFINDIASGRHLRCSICSKSLSKGEYLIKKWLDDNNILYVQQKTFEGCKDINFLRFDFYLPIYNMVIEFNGSQHYYESSQFQEGKFEYTKKHDEIKKKYCFNEKIKYLEIPYWDLKKDKYKDILLNSIKE